MSIITKDSLLNDLKLLGIKQGDTLFVRASLFKIGRVNKQVLIDALIDSVGEKGTLVTLGFTASFLSTFSKGYKKHIFDPNETQPNIGALSSIFFKHPLSKRSKHPTNSYIAIGKHSGYVVSSHDEYSLAYTPIKKLIELDAKMLLIGCVEDSPGFTTVHYNQELLGITVNSLLSRMYKTKYISDGKVKKFTRKDFGGCSSGFKNFYPDYKNSGFLVEGKIGSAFTYMINAKDAFEIEKKILEANISYFLCSNPECFSCRVAWPFNRNEVKEYIKAKIIRRIKK